MRLAVHLCAYDPLDQMTDVSETPAGSTTATNLAHYAYDALERRQMLAYANGTSTAYGYDPFNGLGVDPIKPDTRRVAIGL